MEKENNKGNLSRRKFVKNVVVAGTGLVAGQSVFAKGEKLVFPGLKAKGAGSKTLKIGIVGMGGRGTGAVLDSLNSDPNVQLWAAGDVFDKRINDGLAIVNKHFADRVLVPKERQFVGFDAYQKVIDSGVDVVLLATTAAFRPLHLKAAIDAGKHVFAEKPLAVDMAGMKSVIATAEKAKSSGLSIMTGLVWRYTPSLNEMHEKIQAGEIGDVTYASSAYCGGGRPNPAPSLKYKPKTMSDMEWAIRYWQNYVELSGDGIMEFMVHGIDKLSWGMGDRKPVRCYANGGNAVPHEGSNNWDNFSLFFEYEDGVKANFLGRQIPGTSTPSEDYILGSKGHATLQGDPSIVKNGKVAWTKPLGNLDYINEHRILNNAIRKGKTYNDILGKMEVSHIMTLMGRAAAYTGSVITWDQIMESNEILFEADNVSFDTEFTPRETALQGKTKFV